MITTWEFPNHGIQTILKVTVDSDYIDAYGGADFPHLAIPVQIERIDRSGTSPNWTKVNRHKAVWAIGIDLFLDQNQPCRPVFQSGLQEHPLNSVSIAIPVSSRYLELVSQNTGGNGTSVALYIRVTLLIDSLLIKDAPDYNPFLTSDVHHVFIPTSRWYQTLLPKLGYPQTRLVPLVLNLPTSLALQNPPAEALWSSNLKNLNVAINLFQTWHFEPTDLVKHLRPVIENTVITWLHVWNLDIPASGKSDEILQTLNKALQPHSPETDVKPCNASNGVIPVSAPHKRLCIVLTMLHDLLSLSNVESHARTQGTFTMADAESLLYMTTGILRSLPQLWEEYPVAPNSAEIPS